MVRCELNDPTTVPSTTGLGVVRTQNYLLQGDPIYRCMLILPLELSLVT